MADAGDLKSLAGKHVGSNPTTGTIFVPVAQLVEQGTFNPKAVGSIPTGRTIFVGLYGSIGLGFLDSFHHVYRLIKSYITVIKLYFR